MLLATVAFAVLGLCFGVGLGITGRLFPRVENSVADAIEELLPRTQCAQCGYPGCRPYAAAIANAAESINRCPPSGAQTIAALAALLGEKTIPLADDVSPTRVNWIANIDEAECIGCTLCLDACPVDAIIGASRHMHTVIAGVCTGCELCGEPCPVDCITMDEAAPWVI